MRDVKMRQLTLSGVCFLIIVNFMMAYADGPIYVAVEGGNTPGIWRLEDLNGDEDALDAGERKGFAANGSVGFMDVAVASDGAVYAIAPDESRVYRLVDLNNDGDARDPGEKTIYRDDGASGVGIAAPLSIAVHDFFDPFAQKVRTWVYVMDVRHQLTMRLEDVDGDGDAQGFDEMVMFQQTSAAAPFTAKRMMVDELGRVVACNSNNNTIVRLADINSDGFTLDPPVAGQPCPTPSCGPSSFQEFQFVRQFIFGQQNLTDPFGVTMSSVGDYYVSDIDGGELYIIKLTDLNGDGDTNDVGEIATFDTGRAIGGFDLVADVVGGRDVIFVTEILPGGRPVVTWLSAEEGSSSPGEVHTYADFDGIGTPVGIAATRTPTPPMFLHPAPVVMGPKGPILAVEDNVVTPLTIQVVDQATALPAPSVRIAGYVLAGCFEVCALSDRTDANGEITYEISRTADSPTGQESLKFWVHGDEVVLSIVSEPCGPEPIADAGPDQETFSGLSVTLDGSASVGNSLFYCWQQVGGPDVGLPECTPANTANPTKTFTAPTAPATLTFELMVRNGCGFISAPDTVVVTVAECPAEVVLDDAASLAILTQFRDQALSPNSIGQQVISGYYLHGIEMSTILMTRSGLRRRAFQLITDTMPQIAELVQQGSVVVEQTTLQTAAKFLNDVRRVSSPGLKQFLGQVRQWLLDENVLAQFGVTVQ